MWRTDTYWFDVAIATSGLMLGHLAIAVGLVVVHGWWLPRNGVNGWTGEPRERYYELIGLDPSGKPRGGAG